MTETCHWEDVIRGHTQRTSHGSRHQPQELTSPRAGGVRTSRRPHPPSHRQSRQPRVSSRGTAKATCDSTLVPMTETQPCSLKTVQSGARCGGVWPAWWTNSPSGAPFPWPVGTSAQSTGPHHCLSGPHDAQRCDGDIETGVLPCDSPSLVAGSRSHTACRLQSLVLLTTIKAHQKATSQLGPQNCTFPERGTHSWGPHAEWPD